jgi:hypothetical protein
VVAVFGDLKPRDDYTHSPGADPDHNESAYYNFFDKARGIGGFVRIGNRVNEGCAEVSLVLYMPEGAALFNYQRLQISGNEAFAAGGMRFEVLEPFVRHGSTYEGTAVYVGDATQIGTDPGRALRENHRQEVRLDLVHAAIGPVFGAGGERPAEGMERFLGRAHFEQHIRTRGTIAIDGQTYELDALGIRDHSWGPRTWQAIPKYRWLPCTFTPDFGFRAWLIYGPDGALEKEGILVRGPEHLERARDVELAEEIQTGTRYQRAMTVTLTLESGDKLVVEGAVKSLIPLRNRRAGQVTHIGEGMTEYRCGDLVGLGISEYLEQVQ